MYDIRPQPPIQFYQVDCTAEVAASGTRFASFRPGRSASRKSRAFSRAISSAGVARKVGVCKTELKRQPSGGADDRIEVPHASAERCLNHVQHARTSLPDCRHTKLLEDVRLLTALFNKDASPFIRLHLWENRVIGTETPKLKRDVSQWPGGPVVFVGAATHPRGLIGAIVKITNLRGQVITSPLRNQRPLSPFLTQSHAAEVSETIAGMPIANASATTNPCVSLHSEGKTTHARCAEAAVPRHRTSTR